MLDCDTVNTKAYQSIIPKHLLAPNLDRNQATILVAGLNPSGKTIHPKTNLPPPNRAHKTTILFEYHDDIFKATNSIKSTQPTDLPKAFPSPRCPGSFMMWIPTFWHQRSQGSQHQGFEFAQLHLSWMVKNPGKWMEMVNHHLSNQWDLIVLPKNWR